MSECECDVGKTIITCNSCDYEQKNDCKELLVPGKERTAMRSNAAEIPNQNKDSSPFESDGKEKQM